MLIEADARTTYGAALQQVQPLTKHDLEVFLIGGMCIGKTVLFKYLMCGSYNQWVHATIGFGLGITNVILDNKWNAKFRIWDPSGNDRFESIWKPMMERSMCGAARREMPTAIIAGYSVTCRGSFTDLQYHLASIPPEASGACCIVWLVAMKADSSNSERQVTRAEMDAFADSHPLLAPSRAFELDCRTVRGVSELLQHMASQFKVQHDYYESLSANARAALFKPCASISYYVPRIAAPLAAATTTTTAA